MFSALICSFVGRSRRCLEVCRGGVAWSTPAFEGVLELVHGTFPLLRPVATLAIHRRPDHPARWRRQLGAQVVVHQHAVPPGLEPDLARAEQGTANSPL